MYKAALASGPIGIALVLACSGGGPPSEVRLERTVSGCEAVSDVPNRWSCSGSATTLGGEFARALGETGATRLWWPSAWHSSHDVTSVWLVDDSTVQLQLTRDSDGVTASLTPVSAPYIASAAPSSPWFGVGFVDVSEQLPGARCALLGQPSLLSSDGSVDGPQLDYGSRWSYTGRWRLDGPAFDVTGAWTPEEGAPSADLALNPVRGVPRGDGWVLLGDTRAVACASGTNLLPNIAPVWVLVRDAGGGSAEVERMGSYLLDVLGPNVVTTTGSAAPPQTGVRIATREGVAMPPSAPTDRLLLDGLATVLSDVAPAGTAATEAPVELWVGRPE